MASIPQLVILIIPGLAFRVLILLAWRQSQGQWDGGGREGQGGCEGPLPPHTHTAPAFLALPGVPAEASPRPRASEAGGPPPPRTLCPETPGTAAPGVFGK